MKALARFVPALGGVGEMLGSGQQGGARQHGGMPDNPLANVALGGIAAMSI